MPRQRYVTSTPDPGWIDRVVIIRTEDECLVNDPDAWSVRDAHEALCPSDTVAETYDGGDMTASLYMSGVVVLHYCDRTRAIGVLPETGS